MALLASDRSRSLIGARASSLVVLRRHLRAAHASAAAGSSARSGARRRPSGSSRSKASISESEDARRGAQDLRRTRRRAAVVVRIDSPGGGVAPSQEIYDEIVRLARNEAGDRLARQHRGVGRLLHRQPPATSIVADAGDAHRLDRRHHAVRATSRALAEKVGVRQDDREERAVQGHGLTRSVR